MRAAEDAEPAPEPEAAEELRPMTPAEAGAADARQDRLAKLEETTAAQVTPHPHTHTRTHNRERERERERESE
eukprot:COSAG03_NODE_9568_length_709_cov_2.965574_2_plen_72_part_01